MTRARCFDRRTPDEHDVLLLLNFYYHLILHLQAKPNARRNELRPGPDGRWLVRLASPAQNGQANAVLLAFLAEIFGVPRRDVLLLSGHTAPFKKVEVTGVSEADGTAILARYGT